MNLYVFPPLACCFNHIFPQQVFMHPDQQSWMCCFFFNVFFQVFFSDSTFVNHREFHHHWGDYFLELVPSPSKSFKSKQ